MQNSTLLFPPSVPNCERIGLVAQFGFGRPKVSPEPSCEKFATGGRIQSGLRAKSESYILPGACYSILPCACYVRGLDDADDCRVALAEAITMFRSRRSTR